MHARGRMSPIHGVYPSMWSLILYLYVKKKNLLIVFLEGYKDAVTLTQPTYMFCLYTDQEAIETVHSQRISGTDSPQEHDPWATVCVKPLC